VGDVNVWTNRLIGRDRELAALGSVLDEAVVDGATLSDDLRCLPRSSRVAMEAALGIGPGPAPERLAVLNAALAVFCQAASRSPLLIVIDDLPWLDRASGAAIGFVGRRLRVMRTPSSNFSDRGDARHREERGIRDDRRPPR
jgi:hypothetical protein